MLCFERPKRKFAYSMKESSNQAIAAIFQRQKLVDEVRCSFEILLFF